MLVLQAWNGEKSARSAPLQRSNGQGLFRDYNKLLEKGVHFVRAPKEEEYGIVAVFEDLYGSLWDLVQPKDHIQGYLWPRYAVTNTNNRKRTTASPGKLTVALFVVFL